MNARENYANDGVLQFTLREMQQLLNRWQFWAVLSLVVVMLTVSGPFGTLDELGAVERFAYWGAIAVFTSLPSFAIAFPFNRIGARRGWHTWWTICAAGLVASVPVSLVVWFISAFLAKNGDATFAGFIEIGLRCLPISIGITAVYTLLTISTRPAAQSPQHAPAMQPPAPFLKRLSPETGTVITTLQAQDHYVEVTTTRGQELVLIRLGDAQKELSGLDGMRVHRSWWVARAAIQSTARDNGRLSLILTDGRKIPVSRSNEKDVRQWLENRLP